MELLIISEPDDIHAALVKLAVEKKGGHCSLLFTADMPSKQKNSICISTEYFSWFTESDSGILHYYGRNFDAIWWRRPREPHIPAPLHEEDKAFVEQENAVYHYSIPLLLSSKAWWVNPISSHAKTQSKIIQLKLAQQCKFKLPKTLISNSPKEIKEFIQQNKQVVYKPFYPQFWSESEGIKIIYTDKITLANLPSDHMLQMVPGIYQQYVEKKYELRITCFGSLISAVKIDSQTHSMGQLDWRKIPAHELALTQFELPQSIKDKIILFMIKSGVVFGCFDFIVTPEEELVFLELNEQGQFLWVEEFSPGLFYLDMFSDFIMQRSFHFSWYQSRKSLSASSLKEEAFAMLREHRDNHIFLNEINRGY